MGPRPLYIVAAIAVLAMIAPAASREAAASTGFDARGRVAYLVSRPPSSNPAVRIDDKAIFKNATRASDSDAIVLSLGYSSRDGFEVFHQLSIRFPATALSLRVGESLDVNVSGIAIDYLERTKNGVVYRSTSASGTIRIASTSRGGASTLVKGTFDLTFDDTTASGESRNLASGTFATDDEPSSASSGQALAAAKSGGAELDDPPSAGCGGEATVQHQTDSSGCGGAGTTTDPEEEEENEGGCSGDSAPADSDSSGGCKGDSDSSDDGAKCALTTATGKSRKRPRSLATRIAGAFGPPVIIIMTLLALRRRSIRAV